MAPTIGSRLTAYLAQLQEDGVELSPDSATLVTDGQYNDVVLVEGRFAFRFPKRKAHFTTARLSAALLNRIHHTLPLAVPRPTAVRLSGRPAGTAYVAYDAVPGVPFHREMWDAITDGDIRRKVVRQLTEFLGALHGVDLARLADLALPRDDHAAWASMYDAVRARLFEYMRPEARTAVAERFDALLGSLDYSPRLIHGDFGTSNLLFDPVVQRIAGVIDFDGARVGDPATDLAALMSYGDAFTSLLVEEWPGAARHMERARLYQGTFALQEALFGLEHHHPDAFEAGIQVQVTPCELLPKQIPDATVDGFVGCR